MKTCALAVFLSICSCSVALVLKKPSTPKACGVVLGAFGSKDYVDIGLRVAKHISALNISQGWCPEQPELSSVPVAFFTDLPSQSCPHEIECFDEKAMPPWEGGYVKFNGSGEKFGEWKYKWYHVQMLLNSPYRLTLYLDVDALPCSGEAIKTMFTTFSKKGASLGSSLVTDNTAWVPSPCIMSPGGDCSAMPPAGITDKDKDIWKTFWERNSGVILADKGKTKDVFEQWAANIKTLAGQSNGDQLPYRQALFKHRKDIKEHIFGADEVCRYMPRDRYNCQEGCLVSHWSGMKSLKVAGII